MKIPIEKMIVFQNKGALYLDRLDVHVVGRDDEASRLRRILQSVDQGYLPKVITVFGPPGSGKTLVTRKVCEEYEVMSGGLFKFVYVNLGEVKTVFSAVNQLLKAVGGRGQDLRVGLDGVMEKFWSHVNKLGEETLRFLVVGLDEVDLLFLDRRGDPSGFLYRLVRSEEQLRGSDVHLSLLVISNTVVWDRWEVDGRVKSSMGVEEIPFPSYSREELEKILVDRCREAFTPGVVEKEVIEGIAEDTAEQSRDVRKMVDLLRITGEIAEESGDSTVRREHLTQAVERVDTDNMHHIVSRLPLTHRLMIFSLLRLKIGGINVPSTNQVYTSYCFLERKPLSYRRIAGILKELETIGLIGGRTWSKGRGGYSREVWLNDQTELYFLSDKLDMTPEIKAKKGFLSGIISRLDEEKQPKLPGLE